MSQSTPYGSDGYLPVRGRRRRGKPRRSSSRTGAETSPPVFGQRDDEQENNSGAARPAPVSLTPYRIPQPTNPSEEDIRAAERLMHHIETPIGTIGPMCGIHEIGFNSVILDKRNIDQKFVLICMGLLYYHKHVVPNNEKYQAVLEDARAAVELRYSDSTKEHRASLLNSFIHKNNDTIRLNYRSQMHTITQAYFFTTFQFMENLIQHGLVGSCSMFNPLDNSADDVSFDSSFVPESRIYFDDGTFLGLGTRMSYIVARLLLHKINIDGDSGTKKFVWLMYCWLVNRLIVPAKSVGVLL